VPAALWVATLLYIRPYDGWGAWAAAPLLLPSILLSVVWGTLGVTLLGQAVVRRQPVDLTVLAATVVSAGPALYYTLRHLLRSAG
jgi:hypothetical protein